MALHASTNIPNISNVFEWEMQKLAIYNRPFSKETFLALWGKATFSGLVKSKRNLVKQLQIIKEDKLSEIVGGKMLFSLKLFLISMFGQMALSSQLFLRQFSSKYLSIDASQQGIDGHSRLANAESNLAFTTQMNGKVSQRKARGL